MKNSFIIMDEADWAKATPDQQMGMIFKTLRSIDCRLQNLEKRALVDKFYSFLGGVFGGFLAAMGIKWYR